MSQRWRNRLPHLVAWSLALVAVLALLLLTRQVTQSESQENERSVRRELSNLSRLNQEHASRTLHAADQTLQFIRTLYQRDGMALDLAALVRQDVLDIDLYHLVGIIDAQGIYRLSNLPGMPPVNLADREHFKVHVARQTDELFVSQPVLGRVSKKWTIQLTRRISRPDGSFAGVAVVSLDADYFARFYAGLDLGHQGNAMLLGRDGRVWAQRDKLPTDAGLVLPQAREMTFLQQGQTEGFFDLDAPLDHTQRLYHFRPVPDFPLSVSVAFGKPEYREFVRQRTQRDWLLASLGSLLLLGFAAFFSWDRHRAQQQHQQLTLSHEHMKLALDSGGLGLWSWNLVTGDFEADQRLLAMLGFASGEVQPDNHLFTKLLHPDDRQTLRELLPPVLSGEVPRLLLDHRLRHKDGHWVYLMARGQVVERDAAGRAFRMAGTMVDRSEQKRLEEEIHRLAFFDPLTLLPNRRLLLDRLQQLCAARVRNQQLAAVLFLDLDHFKQLNDGHGHDQGDALLIQVAQRLRACVREVDTVARLGGDEFVVALAQLGGHADLAHAGAQAVANKILQTMAQPFVLPEVTWCLSASIGVALFLDARALPEDILKQADVAMYQAKAAGRNGVQFFNDRSGPGAG